MTKASQARALKTYREGLRKRGIARFEVQAPERDRALIRDLAKRLAEGGESAQRLRERVQFGIGAQPPRKGSILSALRSSPMVGADLDLSRPFVPPRPVDL